MAGDRAVNSHSTDVRLAHEIHLRLLGGFELVVDGRTAPIRVAEQRLLAFLALAARPLARMYVAGSLWPDLPDHRALGSLRSALWRLHAADLAVIEAHIGAIGLSRRAHVDYRLAIELAHQLVGGSAPDSEVDSVIALLTEDLLPDWYDDWIAHERERFRQLRLHALEAVAIRLARAGRYSDALQAALHAVAAEPLRETAHRAVIEVHVAEGNLGEAMLHYQRYRNTLVGELGIRPSFGVDDVVRRAQRPDERTALPVDVEARPPSAATRAP